MTRARLGLTVFISGVVFASTTWAQPRSSPVKISTELPHVELAAGLNAMWGGAGSDSVRQLRALHLDDHSPMFPRKTLPWTQSGFGLFGQVHVAVAHNAMVGYLVSRTQQDTHGVRTAIDTAPGAPMYSSAVDAHEDIKTRALIVSFRPNAWIKVGAGPALHERAFDLFAAQRAVADVGPHDSALGWVASGELKFRRAPSTDDHPPLFGHVVAQYRAAGSAVSDTAELSLGTTYGGTNLGSVTWPATSLRFSHWMVGVGIGLEF